MRPTSKYAPGYLSWICTLIFAGFLLSHPASAQCTAPSSATITPTPAACQGEGRVVAKINSPVSGATYEYQLQFDSTGNTSVVKPWQSNDTFTQVGIGQYKVYIRMVCGASFSSTYVSASTTVTASTTPLSITQAVATGKSSCGNGSLKVTATGGNMAMPYQYALVPSLTASEPVATYVRPQQSSNVFTDLAAGTYYARVYDDCGTYATATVVIDSVAESVLLSTSNPGGYNFYGCDSIRFAYTVRVNNKLPVNPPSTIIPADAKERFWVTYNGVTDTLTAPTFTYSAALGTSTANPAKVLQVQGGYPMTVTYGYKSACGNIYQNTVTIAQPNLKISLTSNSLSCTQRRYQIRTTDSISGNWNYYNTRLSLDSGATWTALNTTNTYIDTFNTGTTQNIWVASDCDTDKIVVTVLLPNLAVNFNQFTAFSCNGNSGFSIQASNYSGAIDSMKFNVLSKPAGSTLPDSFYMYQTSLFSGATSGYKLTYNLTPGTYTIKITDQCGATATQSITINQTVLSYTISPLLSCLPSQSGFRLNLSETNYNPYAAYSYLRAIVTNTATNQKDSFQSATNLSRPTTIDITGLANGNYTIKVIRVLPGTLPYPSCSVDSFYTNTSNQPLTLTQSTFTSGCDNSTATVAANAQGGGGSYQYSLDIQGAGGTWTAVAGPQSGAVFNNLLPNSVYRIRVTDVCGNGTQYSTSFSSAARKLTYSSTVAPCPGQSFTMSVSNESTATYAWQKNGTPIAGATTSAYTIGTVPASSVDTYKVKIAYGNCEQFSVAYIVDPALCGTSLPINLEYFNGVLKANQQAALNWKVLNYDLVHSFEVEYSTDGSSFRKAGTLVSNHSPFYTFTDIAHNIPVVYYRLKMMGLDQTVVYSNTLKLSTQGSGTASNIRVYPTIVSDKIHISYMAAAAGQINWSITDIKGATPRLGIFTAGAGNSEFLINNLYELPEGIYILNLYHAGTVLHQEKIVIRH